MLRIYILKLLGLIIELSTPVVDIYSTFLTTINDFAVTLLGRFATNS